MAILDCSKLSQDELNALPCVCCGNPLGTPPSSDTYWICPVCDWEEESFQFKYPWSGGGPNGDSLWEARRNFRFTGSVYHAEKSRPFKPEESMFSWRDVLPSSDGQYCWVLDPEMYADYAGNHSESCPLRNARDVLRAFGAFSGRQVLQKILRARIRVPSTFKVSFDYVTIRLSPKQPLIRSVIVDLQADHDAVPVYVQRLRAITEDRIRGFGIQFFSRPSSDDSESVFIGSSRDCQVDRVEYWYKLRFRNKTLQSLEILASEDGYDSFAELDKDTEY